MLFFLSQRTWGISEHWPVRCSQTRVEGLIAKSEKTHLHPSLHMTAPFTLLVSYGFGLLYFVELGLHGLIISGQPSYSHVLCLVVGQTKLVLGT